MLLAITIFVLVLYIFLGFKTPRFAIITLPVITFITELQQIEDVLAYILVINDKGTFSAIQEKLSCKLDAICCPQNV